MNPVHVHPVGFMVLVFVFFTFGAALNVWRHAAGVVNSSLNGVTSYAQYFRREAPIQATKSFAALLILLWWLYHQTGTVGLVGLVWPGGTVPQWLQGILVVNPATAGAFGLFFDVIEDIVIVYLKKVSPKLFPPDVPPPAAG